MTIFWIGFGCFMAGCFFMGILGAAVAMASSHDDAAGYDIENFH